MAAASGTQVHSAMTAMSTSKGVASGNHTSSTTNVRREAVSRQKSWPTDLTQATNTTAASASATGVEKKNVAGQIRGFADTAVILVLIGIVAGL